MLIPVVLSGGSGTRLWPLSRELYPKQLLPLVGDRTMLQETVARLAGVADVGAPVVVCNESHRFMVAEQLRGFESPPQAIVLEPVGRNTAPAVAVAALVALGRAAPAANGHAGEEDPVLLVLPADHVIRDVESFQQAVAVGRAAAEQGKLVTFGVVPDRPETGYGYIRRARGDGPAYPVAEFVEKPDLATAVRYVQSGEYFWNSGMFMFRARTYLAELRQHAPAMLAACEAAVAAATRDLDFTRLPPPSSGPARPTRWTTRSWRRLPPRSSCRSTPAGATWARGPRCRMRSVPTPRATSRRATSSLRARPAATCTRRAG
jgi:mannose-1-phosphate guanylyltransferase/mannose-6-phosphate isomerase